MKMFAMLLLKRGYHLTRYNRYTYVNIVCLHGSYKQLIKIISKAQVFIYLSDISVHNFFNSTKFQINHKFDYLSFQRHNN